MSARFRTDCVLLDSLLFSCPTLVFLLVRFLIYFSLYPKSWKGLCNLISQQANFHVLYTSLHEPYFCCWSFVSSLQTSDNLFPVNATLKNIVKLPNGSCPAIRTPSIIFFPRHYIFTCLQTHAVTTTSATI